MRRLYVEEVSWGWGLHYKVGLDIVRQIPSI